MHRLIIGCGNRLRSNGGVGPMIAEASWRLRGVRALAVHEGRSEKYIALFDSIKSGRLPWQPDWN